MRPHPTRLVIAIAMLIPVMVARPAVAGPSGGALPPPLTRVIEVADRYGIPADAEMVAANVTAVEPAAPGHITVYPCDEELPETSNLNYVAGAVAPNLTLTRIADDGTICVTTFAVSDVIVDIAGYVPAGSNITALPNPVRFLDTRVGSPAPIPAGSTTDIPVAGVSGVADDADVVLFNLTAIGAGQPGHLTTFPCGEPLPDTSSVNFAPGQAVPNLITSRIGSSGSVCVFNFSAAEIIVDVAAFATSGLATLPNPVRVVDTRITGDPVDAGGTLTLDVTARPDVPTSATAAIYNLTSVNAAAPGFATSYPCDIARPVVSNLNYAAGQVSANGTITKLSAAGELCIFTLAQSDLIVDLIGYTEGTTDYVPLDPIRIWDSREGWQARCDIAVVEPTGAGSAPGDFWLLRPGVSAPAPLEVPAGTTALRPDPGCRTATAVVDARVHRIDLDTGVDELLSDDGPWMWIDVLDDGSVVGYRPGGGGTSSPDRTRVAAIDISVAEELFTFEVGIDDPLGWTTMGNTRSAPKPRISDKRGVFEYDGNVWDVGTGDQLATDAGVMAPHGALLASGERSTGTAGGISCEVTTTGSRDPVWSFDLDAGNRATASAVCRWVSPGTVLMFDPDTAYVGDLYGELRPVLPPNLASSWDVIDYW